MLVFMSDIHLTDGAPDGASVGTLQSGAFQEEYIKRNRAEYVVYGHTHHRQVVPLDLVPMPGETLQKTYFNTGIWRRLYEKTLFDPERQEFLSRHVMTFIAFYLKKERKSHQFEVWNGALG